jgi:diguanylate cyclase (GGDEF)-like protein
MLSSNTPPPSVVASARKSLWPQRIGVRLALGFGLLVLLMLLALSQAGLQLQLGSEATRNFATGDMQRLLRVQALSLQTEGVGGALVRLLNAPRSDRVSEYADVDARNRQIDSIMASLTQELHDPEQEDTLKRLQACRQVYAEAFIATVDQLEAQNLGAATALLNDRVNPALKAMLVESNTLLTRERQRVESQLEQALQLFGRVATWVGFLSLLVMVLATWLAWQTARSVVRPLGKLKMVANKIAQGDYTLHMHPTGTLEIDQVGDALNTVADAVAQREQQIVRLAYQDALTGLPNRTALLTPHDTTGQAFNTLALLDLARLKVINETLGYTTGDTLIKELALRAREVFESASTQGLIGPHYVVARLSGGTFAAAFVASDRVAVAELQARIERAVSQSVLCTGHSVDLSLACGLADSGNHLDTKPIEVLLRNAEVALHAAKRQALGHAWYSEAQEAARLGHLSLISDLRMAVAESQLQMWLQPKFSLVDGQPVGAEALVRWVHPQRGFISPADFIPFAEQTGYITMLTDWMLREAVRTLSVWKDVHATFTLSVNLSTRDLKDPSLAKRIKRMLGANGVAPERLCLEITESGLMEDAQNSLALLHALRDIGVQLSIDDFGTGYSSLAYLQKMPVTELKIDRSFVDAIDASPSTQRLVKAMIEMGHGLDLTVTAEGVETQAEHDTLASLGCDVMQGYLRSRPLHGKALQDWLDHAGVVA